MLDQHPLVAITPRLGKAGLVNPGRITELITLLITLLIFGCSSPENNSEDAVEYPKPGHNLSPQGLSQAYCGACHLYPEPELLPKSAWGKSLLKDMGNRLGIKTEGYDPFHRLSMYDNLIVKQNNIYPEDSLISRKDWELIVDYYLSNAPEIPLSQAPKEEIHQHLPGFKVRPIDNLPTQQLTTLVKIDTSTHKIYWGSRLGDLMIIDSKANLDMHLLESAPSGMISSGMTDYVITMGIMDPSEQSVGSLYQIQGRRVDTLLTKLQRPVHIVRADLDDDGSEDFIVSQFGNQTGRLSWFRADNNGQFRERIIKEVAGTVKTEVYDFNNDGKLDIMALFGQGEERISIFYQTRGSKFREEVVLRFPPVYGSSSFQLADFNGDRELDILYTNGDNADYSYSLKAYHGTRIYLNKGENQYQLAYFYPLHGATKSMAGDYDGDGDMDMFTICFFPDFEADFPEGFIYFENQGDLDFKPYSFPESTHGRWLVADTGDVDGDGDEDIVLGSFLHLINTAPPELIELWGVKGYHMVVLENNLY